jgi:hypothetical protein
MNETDSMFLFNIVTVVVVVVAVVAALRDEERYTR